MEKIRKQKSSDLVMEYIIRQIETGEWKPGEKLMPERELAEQLGISRVPLREAIRALGAMGILRVVQGGGTYVESYRPERLARTIQAYSVLNKTLMEEVFEARIVLESQVAGLAAENRTEADLKVIAEAVEAHAELIEAWTEGNVSTDQVMEADNRLHKAVALAAHNSFLAQMVETIRETAARHNAYDQRYLLDKGHFTDSVGYHRRLYQALKERHSREAVEIMKEHVARVKKALNLEKMERDRKEENL